MRMRATFVVAAALAAANAASAQYLAFDFVNSVWDHSAFGGPSANVGWQNGRLGGTSVNPMTGLSATITYESAGTAVRIAGSLGRTVIGSTGETVLRGNASTDYNAGATLDNYVVFRVHFNQLVSAAAIRIYDVDEDNNPDDPGSPSWQDYVTVRAFNGGTPVAVSYTVTDPANQAVISHLGTTGLVGLNQINKSDVGGDAFASSNLLIDEYQLIFTQGPEGFNAGSHTIGLYSVLVAIPEPGSLALAGGAALALLVRRRVRRA